MPGPTADIEKAFDRYNAFDAEQGYKDVEDLMENLRSHPRCNGKAGVLGFCFGALRAVCRWPGLGADAAGALWYADRSGARPDAAGPIVSVATIRGGRSVVPMAVVNQIKSAYENHPNAEIVAHDGSGHNFSMPHKDGYHAGVAATARQAVLDTFNRMK